MDRRSANSFSSGIARRLDHHGADQRGIGFGQSPLGQLAELDQHRIQPLPGFRSDTARAIQTALVAKPAFEQQRRERVERRVQARARCGVLFARASRGKHRADGGGDRAGLAAAAARRAVRRQLSRRAHSPSAGRRRGRVCTLRLRALRSCPAAGRTRAAGELPRAARPLPRLWRTHRAVSSRGGTRRARGGGRNGDGRHRRAATLGRLRAGMGAAGAGLDRLAAHDPARRADAAAGARPVSPWRC